MAQEPESIPIHSNSSRTKVFHATFGDLDVLLPSRYFQEACDMAHSSMEHALQACFTVDLGTHTHHRE